MGRLNLLLWVVNKVSGTLRSVASVYNRFAHVEEIRSVLKACARHVGKFVSPGASSVGTLAARLSTAPRQKQQDLAHRADHSFARSQVLGVALVSAGKFTTKESIAAFLPGPKKIISAFFPRRQRVKERVTSWLRGELKKLRNAKGEPLVRRGKVLSRLVIADIAMTMLESEPSVPKHLLQLLTELLDLDRHRTDLAEMPTCRDEFFDAALFDGLALQNGIKPSLQRLAEDTSVNLGTIRTWRQHREYQRLVKWVSRELVSDNRAGQKFAVQKQASLIFSYIDNILIVGPGQKRPDLPAFSALRAVIEEFWDILSDADWQHLRQNDSAHALRLQQAINKFVVASGVPPQDQAAKAKEILEMLTTRRPELERQVKERADQILNHASRRQ